MKDTIWTAAATCSPALEQLDMSAPPANPDRARQVAAEVKARTERVLRAFRKVPMA